jgi:hypothetical protein
MLKYTEQNSFILIDHIIEVIKMYNCVLMNISSQNIAYVMVYLYLLLKQLLFKLLLKVLFLGFIDKLYNST